MDKLKKFIKSRTTAQFLLLSAMLVELVFVILYPSFFSGNFQVIVCAFLLLTSSVLTTIAVFKRQIKDQQ